MKRRTALLITLILLLLAGTGGAGAWWFYQRHLQTQPPPRPTAPPIYSGSEITLEARIQARDVVSVAAPIAGVIEALYADVGQEVASGQLLADIRNQMLESEKSAAQLALERAQTRVNNLEGQLTAARLEASRASAEATRARMELERLQKIWERQKLLYSEGATPRLLYEKAEKDYQLARAEATASQEAAQKAEERVSEVQKELDNARKVLTEATKDLEEADAHLAAGQLRSPVDGVIIQRKGNAGEEIQPGVRDFFVIAVNLNQLQAVADAPPTVWPRLKPGQPALVLVAEAPEPLPGAIDKLEGGRVFVAFSNPHPQVKPNLTATVRIRLD